VQPQAKAYDGRTRVDAEQRPQSGMVQDWTTDGPCRGAEELNLAQAGCAPLTQAQACEETKMFSARILKKVFTLLALTACVLTSSALGSGSVPTTITITATVEPFAEWAGTNTTSIAAGDWTAHFTAANQTKGLTAPLALTLYANTNPTITPTATDGNLGVLTLSAGHTLTTKYKLTGDVVAADGAFKTAAAFLAGSYATTPGLGTYTINLDVQATGPLNAAPDAGDYTCQIILTAGW
jgi:hypothetical protein